MHWITLLKPFPLQSLSQGMSKSSGMTGFATKREQKMDHLIHQNLLKTNSELNFRKLLFLRKPLENYVNLFNCESEKLIFPD